MPRDQGLLILSGDGPDGTRMSQLPSVKKDSHPEESDSIRLDSSFPGGTKGLKGRQTDSCRNLNRPKEQRGKKLDDR